MSKVVIVYHSGYGHTQRVAQHVAEGAQGELLAIDAEGNLPENAWDKLNAADAIIFGAWQDKVFGAFTNSASPVGDKGATLISLQTLASQHGGIWVSLGLLPSNKKESTRQDVNSLGGSVGLLVQSPSDASVDEIPQGDLDTAKRYGQRVAEVAARVRG